MDKRAEAKKLLNHYLSQASSFPWTGDNTAEVDTIVDLIIEAAAEISYLAARVRMIELTMDERVY